MEQLKSSLVRLEDKLQKDSDLVQAYRLVIADLSASEEPSRPPRTAATTRKPERPASKAPSRLQIVCETIATFTKPWSYLMLHAALRAKGHSYTEREVQASIHKLRKQRRIQVHQPASGRAPALYAPGVADRPQPKPR
jgi:hypothetical protein